jgi:hypothetical protein
MPGHPPILIEVSPGELVDKLTILRIKAARLTEPAKLANVRRELALLETVAQSALPSSQRIDGLQRDLSHVNESLWQVEDDLRLCERNQEFGPHFIELARSVYRLNDQRSRLKRQLNDLLGSPLCEEKQLPTYP